MQFFRDTFNNREIAIIIWATLFLGWLFFKKKSIRLSFTGLLSSFLKIKITIIFLVMTLYIIFIVTLLNRVNIWDLQLLKDTILWYFGVAIVMLVNTNEANINENYFKKIIVDNIKFVLVLEFIINLYTFSLPVELIFVPVIAIIVMVHTFTEHDDEYKIVKNFLFKVLTVVGIGMFIHTIIRIIYDFGNLANSENFRSFIFPPIISILFLPFIYIFALIMVYETLFIRMKIFNDNQDALNYGKLKIFINFNINLRKLNNFVKSETIVRFDNKEDIDEIINKYRG